MACHQFTRDTIVCTPVSRSERLYAKALPVECPYCGAFPTQRCYIRERNATFLSRPHQARLDAARRGDV